MVRIDSFELLYSVLLTLAHKVLQVVPLDIVGEVADVDTAVLLRVFAHVLHHLFFCDDALLKVSGSWCCGTSFTVGRIGVVVVGVGLVGGSGGGGSVDGRAGPAFVSSVVITRA
jgi:hypothetical protein